MFELNLASLPNHILYLEGVQLSYIKVFVHIFNLWQSDKPCYISNPEFCKRTRLHIDTVKAALQFFEKNNVFKRVQKGSKRYLVQSPRAVEIEDEAVDKVAVNSTNIDTVGEDRPPKGGKIDPPNQAELDPHNIKTNNKYKKSFCSAKEQKKDNQKKHDFANNMDQMANEKKHIEENTKLKRTKMPDYLKAIVNKKCKGIGNYDRTDTTLAPISEQLQEGG